MNRTIVFIVIFFCACASTSKRGPYAQDSQQRIADANAVPRFDSAEQNVIRVFDRTKSSVVYITRVSLRRNFFGFDLQEIPEGAGSGIVWDDRGHIVTNYHVIRGANSAQVTLDDNSVWAADLVGYYADKDVAVLKIGAPAEKLRPIAIGRSQDLVVGQRALAIGNPFGLDHTLSVGVVSGLGREIRSLSGRPIEGVIQTDAAINPGNSGGPLLDSAGMLIGINTQILSPSGASAGVGFAVPVDTVERVVSQLIKEGRVTRAGLGVVVDETGLSKRAGIVGALVLKVSAGSAAQLAGILPTRYSERGELRLGDVIVAVDDKKITDADDLYRVLAKKSVGQKIALRIRRNRKTLTVSAVLQAIDSGQ